MHTVTLTSMSTNMISQMLKKYIRNKKYLFGSVCVRSTSVLCELCFQFELKVTRKDHGGLAAGTFS